MNPVEKIGRYQLPILNVVAIEERRLTRLGKIFSRLGLIKGGYNVTLVNGHMLHFTQEEKRLHDEAMQKHALTMQVYGFCRGLGLRT